VSSITEESRTKGHFVNQKAPVRLRTSLNFHRDDEQQSGKADHVKENVMFSKLATIVVKNPWKIIAAWIVLAIAVIAFAPSLANYTTSSAGAGLPASYESVQAQNTATKYFPQTSGATGTIVVTAANGSVITSSTDQTSISGLATQLTAQKIPGVYVITAVNAQGAPTISQNQKAQIVTVVFTGQPGSTVVNNAVDTIRTDTTAYFRGTGLVGGLTGNAAISVDTTNAYASAETIITIATVLAIVILLALIFRSIIIAFLPIVVIGVVHAMAQGVTAWLADGFGFQVGNELAPLLVVVMFGVGTDYIVFLLFRYRNDIIVNSSQNGVEHLEGAVSKIGAVIASAATTVITAFAALLVASLESLQTLAPGLIVGVFFMMLAGLTLVPALFKVLGKTLFFPYHPRAPKKTTQSERMAHLTIGHRAISLIVGIVIMAGLALGCLGFKTTYNQLAELPGSTPSLIAYNAMSANFPAGYLGPTQVFVTGVAPLNQTAITNLYNKLKATSGVYGVGQPTLNNTDSAAATAVQMNVVLTDNPYSTQAIDLVERTIEPEVNGSVPGDFAVVGGTTAQLVDVRAAMKLSLDHVIPLALIIVGIIIGLLLLAISAPFWILIGVALLYAAVLGTVLLVFVAGFGFVGVDFTLPLVAYLFVMAVGSDYNILIAHQLREAHKEGLDKKAAAKQAIKTGAPAVTAAGLILAATFASLLFTGIEVLEEIGLAVVAACLLTAYILTTKMLPALSATFGNFFWWPSHKTGGKAASGGTPSTPEVPVS
jgi:RND superfamily putative drug exporter